MLTAKQRELLVFIDGHIRKHGISPSFDEMKERYSMHDGALNAASIDNKRAGVATKHFQNLIIIF